MTLTDLARRASSNPEAVRLARVYDAPLTAAEFRADPSWERFIREVIR